jgi:hypothetical protein
MGYGTVIGKPERKDSLGNVRLCGENIFNYIRI